MKKHNKENILIGHLPINDILTWKNNYNKLANDLVKYDKKIDDIYVSDVQDTYIYYNEEHGVYSSPYSIEYALNDEYKSELNNIVNIANSYPNDFLKLYLNDYSEDNLNSIDFSKYQFKEPKTIVRIYNDIISCSEQLSITRCGDSGRYSIVNKLETNNVNVNHYIDDNILRYSNKDKPQRSKAIHLFIARNNLRNRFYIVHADSGTSYIVESVLYKSENIQTVCSLASVNTLRSLRNSGLTDKVNEKQYSIMRENIDGQIYYMIIVTPDTGFINHYLEDMIKEYSITPTSKVVPLNLFNAFNIDMRELGYFLVSIGRTSKCATNYLYIISKTKQKKFTCAYLIFENISDLKASMMKNGFMNKEYIYIKHNSKYICIRSNGDIPVEYGDDYELVLFDENNKATTLHVSLIKNNNFNLIMEKIK